VIRQYSRQVDDLARQQRFWYPAGSGAESRIDTAAKAEIWTHPKEFADAQQALIEQAAVFMKAAEAGDLANIKTQQRALGGTCKHCHAVFREEE